MDLAMEYIHIDKDGNQTKFTDEMITVAIDERNELRTKLEEEKRTREEKIQFWRDKFFSARSKVEYYFNERYTSGEDIIECDVDSINELLSSIGAETLRSLYSVSGSINFSIVDVEAKSEEEAREIVENDLCLEFSGDGTLSEWNIDIDNVDSQ